MYMILEFDIALASATLLPVLFYLFIIYLTSPFKTISLKYCLAFFVAGIFAPVCLDLIHAFFPLWNSINIISPIHQQFLTVAPQEELCKYIMFFIVYKNLDNEYELHPISYMYYFAIIGLGFAFIENIAYVSSYGPSVIMPRILGPTIVHMFCGLLFGYWISLSRLRISNYFDRNTANVYLFKKPLVKKFAYWTIGFITACMFHGLWNFNIQTSGYAVDTVSIILLFTGFVTVKLLRRDLIIQYNKTLK